MSPEIIGAIVGPLLSALIAVAGFFARERYEQRKVTRLMAPQRIREAASSPLATGPVGPGQLLPGQPSPDQARPNPAWRNGQPAAPQQAQPGPPQPAAAAPPAANWPQPSHPQPGLQTSPTVPMPAGQQPSSTTQAWPTPWTTSPTPPPGGPVDPTPQFTRDTRLSGWPATQGFAPATTPAVGGAYQASRIGYQGQRPVAASPLKKLFLLDLMSGGAKVVRVLFYLAVFVAVIWVLAVIDVLIVNPDPEQAANGAALNAFVIAFTTSLGILPAVFAGMLARGIEKRWRNRRWPRQLPGWPGQGRSY